MARHFLVATSAIVLFAGGAATLVAWFTREVPAVASAAPPPPSGVPAPTPVAVAAVELPPEPAPVATAFAELPEEPTARERASEANEARQRFEAMWRGFSAGAERSLGSEARILPALDAAFPRRTPRWTLECRGLVCRLHVDAPASTWRDGFSRRPEARQHVDRAAWDPAGTGLVFLQLVTPRTAEGPPRPDGEGILEDLERELLASEAARACVAEGSAPEGAEVRLLIDRSGVTYRLGARVDRRVASCLMMQALPDVMASASAPPGVQQAERRVVIRRLRHRGGRRGARRRARRRPGA